MCLPFRFDPDEKVFLGNRLREVKWLSQVSSVVTQPECGTESVWLQSSIMTLLRGSSNKLSSQNLLRFICL
jgi:hypothetical protein